jgi:nucleotide-binding universal stress UspA family protein
MSTIPTILHPTDFSEPAWRAFNLAGSLAHVQGARLIVLHVADPLTDPAHPLVGGLPLDKQRQLLEQLRLEVHGVPVERRLASGGPAAEILKTARETGCDLIVMGTHGRTGLGRLFMGSVAEQVVRQAPCPVVTVKSAPREPAPEAEGASEAAAQPPAAPIRTVLHPTDFSEPCAEAFRVACALARDQSARLIVVHVAVGPPVAPVNQPLPPPLPEDPRAKLEELLRQSQASAPGLQADYRVEQGHAATCIVGAAQETQCDLIVMGTHGRTGFGRALMGSVAEQVLRTAPCPVVTVRALAKA